MLTISKQQWNDRFRKLPENIRGVLMDPDHQLADRVDALCKHHEFDELSRDVIARNTSYLLMGFVKPTDFVRLIVEESGLPREKAILIAQDLNRDIFNNVKDSLKIVHPESTTVSKSPEQKPEKPASVPTATLPSSNAPAPAKPANEPLRSDWGWHGKLNEVTGQVEYKREGATPDNLLKSPFMPQGNTAGATHVGSIFEQKLGGAFRMKGESVQYEVTPSPDKILPQQNLGGQAPALNKLGLRVPHKPTEVKIPPAQATLPPKT